MDQSRFSDRPPRTTFGGHEGPILCCHVIPGLSSEVLTGSEDGTVARFDLREGNRRPSSRFNCFAGADVASISSIPGQNENILLAAAGSSVFQLDGRMAENCSASCSTTTTDLDASSSAPHSAAVMHKFSFNRDEINQIDVNSKGSFLVAADDVGEIKVINLHSRQLHKTLHSRHSNICSSVQFHPHRPWEVLSAGLDCRVVRWDFSSGRAKQVFDFGDGSEQKDDLFSNGASSKLCNPPLVHDLAIIKGFENIGQKEVLVAARGDGCLSFHPLDDHGRTVSANQNPKRTPSQRRAGRRTGGRGGKCRPQANDSRNNLEFSEDVGAFFGSPVRAHSAAATSLAFASSAEKNLLISGGNDGAIVFFNVQDQLAPMELNSCEALEDDDKKPKTTGIEDMDGIFGIQCSWRHGKKVNDLCILSGTQNLGILVCDTSSKLSNYSIL